MKYFIKIIYLILTACFIIFMPSCKNDDINRESIMPESGAYEFMLDPENWIVITPSYEQQSNQLILFNSQDSFLLTVDRYKKSNLSDIGVSDLDSFIDFYKTLDTGKAMYEIPEDNNNNKQIEDLTEIPKKEIKSKDSDVKSGKRQQINIQGDDGTGMASEILYLETETDFFALSYGAFAEKFDDSQKSVNDAIAHLKIIK